MPPSESTEQLQERVEQLARRVRDQAAALADYRALARDLERRVESYRNSKTWRLMLAFSEAGRSFRDAAALPARVGRILTPRRDQPARRHSLPPKAGVSRRSKIEGWPADLPLLTVGVVAGQRDGAAAKLLDDARAWSFEDFELVVAASDAESEPLLAASSSGPPVQWVEASATTTRAACWNRIAVRAKGKYVVVLDGRTRVEPTYFEKALWVLECSAEHGFCFPLVEASPAAGGPVAAKWEPRPGSVPAAAVFRREAWADAGGFDEGEEFPGREFWAALGRAGWAGYRIPEMLLTAEGPAGSESQPVSADERDETAGGAPDADSSGSAPAAGSAPLGKIADAAARRALESCRPPEGSTKFLSLGRRSFRDLSAERPAILWILPWLEAGGAEQVALQIMAGLSDRFSFAVVTTVEAGDCWRNRFRELTPWVYSSANLEINKPDEFLSKLAAAHGIRGVVISHSRAAYDALPELRRNDRLWLADIIHNTAGAGYLAHAVRGDRHLDLHFAVGREQLAALTAAGVSPEKVRLVPTSVDTGGRFDPVRFDGRRGEIRRRLGIGPDDTVLSFIGRFSSEKDAPLFVRAVSEIARRSPDRPLRALMVGEGPERPAVEDEIERLDLDSLVRLAGPLDNVEEILAVSDYLLLTSNQEGSPIVLLEAMSMKAPVIAAAVGNIPNLIDHGVNGFLVSERSPAAFAECFFQAENDKRLRTSVAEAARRTVVECFDEEKMLDAYAETFTKGVAARRGGE